MVCYAEQINLLKSTGGNSGSYSRPFCVTTPAGFFWGNVMKQTKKCSHCKQKLDLSRFQKNCSAKDGLQDNCKLCRKLFQKNNKCKYKAYQKAYRQTEKAKLNQKKHRARNTQKIKARNAVCHAVRDGKLTPANQLKCICGNQAEQYHHHKGYTMKFRLDVIPLCVGCHYIIR